MLIDDDATLLRAWTGCRNEDAFRRLVERYAGLVFGAARRRTRDDDLAAEAAQDVFVKLAQRAGSIRRAESLPSVFAAWQEKDPDSARAALHILPPDIWQPSFATGIGIILGASKVPDAETMVSHVPETVRASFWAGVAFGSLDKPGGDVAVAVAAFAQLPDGDEERMPLTERMVEKWLSSGDSAAASEWVSRLPRDMARDFAAATLAERLILTDPEAAKKWAEDIRNDRMRQGVLKKLTP